MEGRPNLDSARALMLSNAIKSGNLETVNQLLTTYAIDINSPLDGSWPPFLHACLHCQFDIMVHFLNLGADPKFQHNFFNALMAVCSSSCTNEEVVFRCARLLINQGLPINERDWQRTSALMYAAKNGHLEVVKELLDWSAAIDAQDAEGWSPIFYAASQNRLETVRLLIDKGASLKFEDRHGRKVNDIAEQKGFHDIAKLISENTDETVPEDYIDPPIHLNILSYKDMVTQLPENNEFVADTLNFLHNLYLERYTRTFYDQNISLGTLLLMDEDDLRKAGVYLSSHRKLILSSAKKFHLSTWKNNCFGSKKVQKVQSDELAFFLGNVTRHLYTLTQSTKYIIKLTDKKNSKVFSDEFKPIILKSIDQLNFIEKNLERTRDFGTALQRNDKVTYVDLIDEKSLNTENKVLSKFVKFYLPSAVSLILILRYKKFVPPLIRLFLNKVPLSKSFNFW